MCQLLAYFDNPVQPFSLGYSWKYFWYRQNKNLDLKIISGKEKNTFFGYHSTKWQESWFPMTSEMCYLSWVKFMSGVNLEGLEASNWVC